MSLALLNAIPADKARHFSVGAVIFAVTFVALHFASPLPLWAPLPSVVALLLVVVAGVAKEASDWYIDKRAGTQVHTVELGDVAATVAGGVVCWIVAFFA